MFTFTIRDLLWLTVVAALAVSACLDHQRRDGLRSLGKYGGSFEMRKEMLASPDPSAPSPNPPQK